MLFVNASPPLLLNVAVCVYVCAEHIESNNLQSICVYKILKSHSVRKHRTYRRRSSSATTVIQRRERKKTCGNMKEWKAVNKSFDEALWQSECSERKKKITGKNDAKELLNRINRKDINYNIFIIYGDFNKQSRTHTEEKNANEGRKATLWWVIPFHTNTHAHVLAQSQQIDLWRWLFCSYFVETYLSCVNELLCIIEPRKNWTRKARSDSLWRDFRLFFNLLKISEYR